MAAVCIHELRNYFLISTRRLTTTDLFPLFLLPVCGRDTKLGATLVFSNFDVDVHRY